MYSNISLLIAALTFMTGLAAQAAICPPLSGPSCHGRYPLGATYEHIEQDGTPTRIAISAGGAVYVTNPLAGHPGGRYEYRETSDESIFRIEFYRYGFGSPQYFKEYRMEQQGRAIREYSDGDKRRVYRRVD